MVSRVDQDSYVSGFDRGLQAFNGNLGSPRPTDFKPELKGDHRSIAEVYNWL